MGLDAHVYCNCLEKSALEKRLPEGVAVKIEANGYPLAVKNGEEIWEDHADWSEFACVHEARSLLHHRLGNIALIGILRSELSNEAKTFPILLKKVVYNGIHASDHLSLDLIPALRKELDRLSSFKCEGDFPTSRLRRLIGKIFLGHYYTSAEAADEYMGCFRVQMLELADAASRVEKPIAFA